MERSKVNGSESLEGPNVFLNCGRQEVLPSEFHQPVFKKSSIGISCPWLASIASVGKGAK